MGKTGRILVKSESRLEMPDEDPWALILTWAEVDGRAECVGLEVRSYEKADEDGQGEFGGQPSVVDSGDSIVALTDEAEVRPVHSGTIRAITMRDIETVREVANQVYGEGPQDGEIAEGDYDPGLWEQTRRAFQMRGSKLVDPDGRVLSPDEALQYVADLYRQAWRTGANPTETVAQTLGLSRSAAGKRVHRARLAGLLPETTRGKVKVIED